MSVKDHWLSKVQPLGNARVEIAYQRTFSQAEAETLRAGLWPQSMDDKWVVFLGDSSLDLWRSWTGHCIYSLPVHRVGDGVTVGPLLVNGDSQQYRRTGDADDIRIFEAIIGRVLSV
jgi:hypothetical protein